MHLKTTDCLYAFAAAAIAASPAFAGNVSENGMAVSQAQDGGYVVVGYVGDTSLGISIINSTTDFLAIRLDSLGNPDPSFGSQLDGTVRTDLSGSQDIATSLITQSDQKIIAAGYAGEIRSDFGIVRYNSDGSLDPTFGNAGITTTDLTGNQDVIQSIALQSTGKLVAVGYAYVNDATTYDFALARYDQSGIIDSTFGGGIGYVFTAISSQQDAPEAAAVATNDKIVVSGFTYSPISNNDFVVARYMPDGLLDATFGSGGIVTTDLTNGAQTPSVETGTSLAVQSDQKIVLIGSSSSFSGIEGVLVRYNEDGTLDSTFGSNGIVRLGGESRYPRGVLIQPDGKLVIVSDGSTSYTLKAQRFQTDGTVDTTFGTNGALFIPLVYGGNGRGIAATSNGFIITGTAFDRDGNSNILAVRVSETGVIDGSFYYGTPQDNYLTGTESSDAMNGADGNDALVGSGGSDSLVGSDGSDILDGGDGADTLAGGTGGDALSGGNGNDTTSYMSSPAGVTVDLSSGTASGGDATGDTLTSVENVEGTSQADTVVGSADDNVIVTADGNDTVTSGAGNDTVNAGPGDDLIVGGSGEGNDNYNGGDGTDTARYSSAIASITVNLRTGAAYSTAGNDAASIGVDSIAGIENIISGSYDDVLQGSAENNDIYGGDGSDIAVFAGTDTEYRFIYDGNSNSLTVIDKVSGRDGTDVLFSVEGLKFANSAGPISSYIPNKIIGSPGSETIIGSVGNDELYGLAGIDKLVGNAGSDLLDGGEGPDTMEGGDGNDSYIVDNAGDKVKEAAKASGGTDTVYTSLPFYTLPAGVENLVYTGGGNFSGKGNKSSNRMYGGPASDVLDGQKGVDVMAGGAGDDTYVVDSPSDLVNEDPNGGVDQVISSVTITTLSQNVEVLTLKKGNINGTGNALDNVIIGSTSNNILSGGDGADTLIGGMGNDTFFGETAASQGDDADTISYGGAKKGVVFSLVNTLAGQKTGGAGTDRIYDISGIENLTGTSFNDILSGSTIGNLIHGSEGNDLISGLAGSDVLFGDAGLDVIDCGADTDADRAAYAQPSDSQIGANRDQITSFSTDTDLIELSLMDANVNAGGDQAFAFSNTTSQANSVWYIVSGTDVVVQGDVNGDAVADFEILVKGAQVLQTDNFAL